MRFTFFVTTAVLTLGVGIAAAQSAEESAVNSRVDELYAALNRGDVEGYVANFHEDAVYAIGLLSVSVALRSRRLRAHALRMA